METVRRASAHSRDFASQRKANPVLDSPKVQRALETAEALYGDRTLSLMGNERLLDHVRGVTAILVDFLPDEDALCACILQHSLKQGGDFSMQSLTEQFGRGVRDLVSRVHLLSHLSTKDWRKSIDDMKIMLVSVSDDMRVLLIKLCIECYHVENLQRVKEPHRIGVCRDALQLFAPVAARLGIYALKYRLETRAFPVCYATDSEKISQQMKIMHGQHGEYLPKLMQTLRKFLDEEGMPVLDIMAREKHPYSMFQKMQRKSVTDIRKITDLIAIRVVVKSLPDCYQVLGLLHRIATPISHRFKDYISFPKPNGYQSLHTSLIGLPSAPKDAMIEVQIRTLEMHREAEFGIAAHWVYKEGKAVQRSIAGMQLGDTLMRQTAVRNQRDTEEGSMELTERKLVDHIYVLTPTGDIIELPEDGTPLDFAFSLHTELGLKFKAARVNGAIVPLGHKLENGDVVEIITHREPRPTLQWLDELATSSARAKLKAYFSSHNRPQFIIRGRDVLNAELRTRRMPPLDGELSALKKFDGKSLTMREREDLLVKLGMGSIRTSSVFRHISEQSVPPKLNRTSAKTVKAKIRPGLTREIGDEHGRPLIMPYRFAKCCNPGTVKPRPEEIAGFITRLGHVSIHKDDCGMMRSANKERRIDVTWL